MRSPSDKPLPRCLPVIGFAATVGVPGRVSGHSLRIGSAQSLAAAGAGEAELREAMPARYTRHQTAARGAGARFRYGSAKV